jgi:hypothetical protein
MYGTAAHLADRVFPEVRVRQWVLSVPFELRLTLARHPAALSAVGRIFIREISRWQRSSAGLLGLKGSRVRTGAVQFPQRFGGSLCRWLRRKGLLQDSNDQDDFANEAAEQSALDLCLKGSLGRGELSTLPAGHGNRRDHDGDEDAPQPVKKNARRHGTSRGFDIHAGVVIEAHDASARERLFRYCARAPLALERLTVLSDGRIAYALSKPWGQQTQRVMTPVQFLARLCALIPPPRHPLIRFHGVFAPHSHWRKHVVPEVTATAAARGEPTECSAERPKERPKEPRPQSSGPVEALPEGRPKAVPAGEHAALQGSARSAPPVGPRCGTPAARGRGGAIPWSELLRRVYKIDALACPCGGRLQFISLILDRRVAAAILESLHLPSEPPPIPKARGPCSLSGHSDWRPDSRTDGDAHRPLRR